MSDTISDLMEIFTKYSKSPTQDSTENFDLEKIESVDQAKLVLESLSMQNKLKAAQLELLVNQSMAQAYKANFYESYLKREGKGEIIVKCNDTLKGSPFQTH